MRTSVKRTKKAASTATVAAKKETPLQKAVKTLANLRARLKQAEKQVAKAALGETKTSIAATQRKLQPRKKLIDTMLQTNSKNDSAELVYENGKPCGVAFTFRPTGPYNEFSFDWNTDESDAARIMVYEVEQLCRKNGHEPLDNDERDLLEAYTALMMRMFIRRYLVTLKSAGLEAPSVDTMPLFTTMEYFTGI